MELWKSKEQIKGYEYKYRPTRACQSLRNGMKNGNSNGIDPPLYRIFFSYPIVWQLQFSSTDLNPNPKVLFSFVII